MAYEFDNDEKVESLKRKLLKRKASQGPKKSIMPEPNVAQDTEIVSIQDEQPIDTSAQDELT